MEGEVSVSGARGKGHGLRRKRETKSQTADNKRCVGSRV